MANDFLQLPLMPGLITSRKQLRRCSLYDSVAGMMHLITITQFGENKHDDSFGNEIWEYDFENIDNIQSFNEMLSESLCNAIERHEKRLMSVRVDVGFEQVETTAYNRRIRQRIHVNIEGILRKTNEPFTHYEVFFMGPLSYY